MASPAQIAANRRNAAHSTGPNTEQGKARSRRNALKHGMTGAGVAVPDEDAAAVEERFQAFESDLRPRGPVAQFLVRRVALLSVRLERCARNEAASITRAMLEASDTEADERARAVAGQIALLQDDPAEAVRKLQRSPEGIAWLIASWEAARTDLQRKPSNLWTPAEGERLERLSGQAPRGFAGSRIAAIWHASRANDRYLKPSDWPDLSHVDRQAAAFAELLRMIADEIARLRAAHDALDHEAIARVRDGAAARALFDTSKPAVLARKYEANAEREFYKALQQAERADEVADARAEADGPDPTPDATPEKTEPCGQLGSFFPTPEEPARTSTKPEPAAPDRTVAGPKPVQPLPGGVPTRPNPAIG